MQLIPRYLVKSRTTAVVNVAGFITEYRPVYTHNITITKGIDNLIEFRFLNADQKPVDVATQTVYFVAYDENKIKVLEIIASATSTKGLVEVRIPKEDLENLPGQYLRYTLYLDDSGTQTLTYSDTHFGNSGTIYLDAGVFPVPRGDIQLEFTSPASIIIPDPDPGDSTNFWATDPVVATPSGEIFPFENMIIVNPPIANSDITIQYTTDRAVTLGSEWVDIQPNTITTDSTDTRIEFNGTYNYIRAYTTVDPTTITSILLRN